MKQKTHKALASRLKRTKSGKFMKRYVGQDHFNSRDTGKASRKKRRDVEFPKVYRKAIRALLPYS